MSIPRPLENLVSDLSKTNNSLEREMVGGEESDNVQMVLTLKNEHPGEEELPKSSSMNEKDKKSKVNEKINVDENNNLNTKVNEADKKSVKRSDSGKGNTGKVLKKQGKIIEVKNDTINDDNLSENYFIPISNKEKKNNFSEKNISPLIVNTDVNNHNQNNIAQVNKDRSNNVQLQQGVDSKSQNDKSENKKVNNDESENKKGLKQIGKSKVKNNIFQKELDQSKITDECQVAKSNSPIDKRQNKVGKNIEVEIKGENLENSEPKPTIKNKEKNETKTESEENDAIEGKDDRKQANEKETHSAENGNSNGNNSTKTKKKNPFKKLKKDKKGNRKGKLQISLSIDVDTDDALSDYDDVDKSSDNGSENQKENTDVKDFTDGTSLENEKKSKLALIKEGEITKEEIKANIIYNANEEKIKDEMRIEEEVKREQKKMEKLQSQKEKQYQEKEDEDVQKVDKEQENSDEKQQRQIFYEQQQQSKQQETEVMSTINKKSWQLCQDCRFSGFCDYQKHKDEYMLQLIQDANSDISSNQACACNVCNGGAVHNGCVYRELVRLRNDFKLFDKQNLCSCSLCIPFKYRTICLREELRRMKMNGNDIYYRLSYTGNDGRTAKKVLSLIEEESDDSSDSNFIDDLRWRMKRRQIVA